MSLCYSLAFLLISLTIFTNCGDDSEESDTLIEDVDISLTVLDIDTGDPIENASVNIGGKTGLTDANGKYILKGASLPDGVHVSVVAANYREYRDTISLDQEPLLFDINLARIGSSSAQILGILESVRTDFAVLDLNRIPSVQSYFSKEYAASENPSTYAVVLLGIIPLNYDKIPDTVATTVEDYSKLELKISDPRIEFSGDSASVWIQFEYCSETKPKPPESPKRSEMTSDARLDFRKENGGWKITCWELLDDKKQAEGVDKKEDAFRKKYVADKENQKKQTWKEYWDWIKVFYNGRSFLGVEVVPGWLDKVEDLLQGLPDRVRKEMEKKFDELGEKIAGEWAKDNDVRSIDTDDLKEWNKKMEEAKNKDKGDGKELNKALDKMIEVVDEKLRG